MLRYAFGFVRRRRLALALAAAGLAGVLALGACVAVTAAPAAGAQGADVLRALLGDQAVAQLETMVFQAQDAVRQWTYQAGVTRPAAPWAVSAGAGAQLPAASPTAGATTQQRHVARGVSPTAQPSQPSGIAPLAVAATPQPPASAGAPAWPPAPLAPMGTLPGEGQWTPYLRSPSGQVVAYRTFLQPDPQRPYALAAIVAFDLTATRLHFVLGSVEPISSVPADRPGTIPPADRRPGLLLAAFNGGFKAQHGHFGAMVDGVTVLPPRDGIGTVALYGDGRVSLGVWGTDITPSPDMLAYRQNGPLIIHDGVINPHTADTAPADWGYTVKGEVAVWRSGLGISADGHTLYYLAGPSLALPVMTRAMAATGAVQALQLDINNHWVHFEAFQADHSSLQPAPLLDSMTSAVGRYLGAYNRDYFYVTANGS